MEKLRYITCTVQEMHRMSRNFWKLHKMNMASALIAILWIYMDKLQFTMQITTNLYVQCLKIIQIVIYKIF